MASPPRCILQVDVGSLSLGSGTAGTCGAVSHAGTVKMRIANLPLQSTFLGVTESYSMQLGGTCGSPAWAEVAVQIEGNAVASEGGSIRFGCDPVAITALAVSAAQIQDAVEVCGSGLSSTLLNLVLGLMAPQIGSASEDALRALDRGRACLDLASGGAAPPPAPCLRTPCASGSACAGGDCGAGTCTCGTCIP